LVPRMERVKNEVLGSEVLELVHEDVQLTEGLVFSDALGYVYFWLTGDAVGVDDLDVEAEYLRVGSIKRNHLVFGLCNLPLEIFRSHGEDVFVHCEELGRITVIDKHVDDTGAKAILVQFVL
jgi:hypothetical protein